MKTHTMMQQLRLSMVAVAFAGLGVGALAGYRLIGTEWRIVTCRPGATALVAETAVQIPGADCVELAGSGHIPAIDAPDATAAAIRDFLGGLDA